MTKQTKFREEIGPTIKSKLAKRHTEYSAVMSRTPSARKKHDGGNVHEF